MKALKGRLSRAFGVAVAEAARETNERDQIRVAAHCLALAAGLLAKEYQAMPNQRIAQNSVNQPKEK